MQRFGLFGGAFNPVHLGHLLVAEAALEELALDKLFFIPASRSPFKQNDETAPDELRLRWLRLALTGRRRFEIDQQEILRGGVSYTIETARHYAKQFPGAELYYLIGADNVPTLNEWRNADELSKLLKFAAVPRPGQAPSVFPKPFTGTTLKGFPLEISSSQIRARIKASLPIESLVPPFVADAICDSGVYR
ncbi:MAG TPA: nicotinate (nicotinamide) nucleotide adenylyltransferase [Verrucomicrobiae bacterium]|nr:nicotinate (nicotinamide) nucleotide adenylyltransferase [Verrucomicrobiae bacterium]